MFDEGKRVGRIEYVPKRKIRRLFNDSAVIMGTLHYPFQSIKGLMECFIQSNHDGIYIWKILIDVLDCYFKMQSDIDRGIGGRNDGYDEKSSIVLNKHPFRLDMLLQKNQQALHSMSQGINVLYWLLTDQLQAQGIHLLNTGYTVMNQKVNYIFLDYDVENVLILFVTNAMGAWTVFGRVVCKSDLHRYVCCAGNLLILDATTKPLK